MPRRLPVCLAIAAIAISAYTVTFWRQRYRAILPLDFPQVIAWTACYGTQALKHTWLNGNLFDVQSNGTHTIKAIDGFPDVATLAALIGISPSSGAGGLPVSRWYDQCGAGNDATQTSAGSQMFAWLIDGKVSMAGDGVLTETQNDGADTYDKWFFMPSGVTSDARASSVFVVAEQASSLATSYNGNRGSPLFTMGTSGGGHSLESGFFGYTLPNKAPFFGSFDQQDSSPAPLGLFPETEPSLYGYIAGASDVTVTQNEESTSTSPALTAGIDRGGAIAGRKLFGSPGLGYFGQMQAFIVAGSTALTTSQQSALRRALYRAFGLKGDRTQTVSMLIDGASLDAGDGGVIGGNRGVQGYGWAQQMLPQLNSSIRLGNTSVPGINLETLTRFWPQSQRTFCTGSYSKRVLFAGGWGAAGNSITTGDTGAQAFVALQTYLAAAKKSCVWDLIIVNGLGGGVQEEIYNNLVRQNAAALGVVFVPMGRRTLHAFARGGPTYFWPSGPPGYAHPTILTYSYMAADEVAALDAAGIR